MQLFQHTQPPHLYFQLFLNLGCHGVELWEPKTEKNMKKHNNAPNSPCQTGDQIKSITYVNAKYQTMHIWNIAKPWSSLVAFCTGVGVESRILFGFGSGVRTTSLGLLTPNAIGSAQVGTAATGRCGSRLEESKPGMGLAEGIGWGSVHFEYKSMYVTRGHKKRTSMDHCYI